MSREIKFRVWDEKSKVMKLWGNLLHQYNTLICLSYDFFKTMQYTGLKDKNDKEIYEGDIIKLTYFDNVYINKVIYDLSSLCFCVVEESGILCPLANYKKYYTIEVVGNIYDNPELLEGDK